MQTIVEANDDRIAEDEEECHPSEQQAAMIASERGAFMVDPNGLPKQLIVEETGTSRGNKPPSISHMIEAA